MSPRWYRDLDVDGRRAVWSTYGGFTLDAMNVQLYAFILPVLLTLWHLSPSRAGIVATAALLSGAIGGWVAGSLSNRIGRVRVLRLTILWLAISTALCGLARSYDGLLLARTIQGVGFGAECAVGAVFIGELAAPATRGRVTGTVQSAWALGWALAAATSAVALWRLPPELGWRATFFVGLLPAAWVYRLRTRLRETPTFSTSQAGGGWQAIFSSPMRGRTLRGSILATGTHGGYWALATWWPTMLRLERGMTAAQATAHLAVLVGGSFAGYPSCRLARRSGRPQADARHLRVRRDRHGPRRHFAAASTRCVPRPERPGRPVRPRSLRCGHPGSDRIVSDAAARFRTRLLLQCRPGSRRRWAIAVGASIAAFGIAPAVGLCVALAYSLVLVAVVLLPETRGCALTTVAALKASETQL